MKIRSLTSLEKRVLREALEHYIDLKGHGRRVGFDRSDQWSAKIIKDEMLEEFLWIEKES